MKQIITALICLTMPTLVLAGNGQVPLGGSAPPQQLGDVSAQLGAALPFGTPALVAIGAISLIAGIKYLRDKRS